MITIAAFSEMLSMIYAAAVTPELWDEAMTHIHQAFTTPTVTAGQARATTLVFADGVSRSMTGSLAPEADHAYGEYYGRYDYVLQAVERGPVGVIRTGTELIAPRTHTEFYADWVRPNGLGDGMFVRLTADAKPTSFLIAGTPGSEPFDNDERTQLFTLLVPHLRQALSAQNSLSSPPRHTGELAEALDSVEHGVIIVGPNSRLVHVNGTAEQMLRAGDGLVSHAGRLSASAPHMRARLNAVLQFALNGDAFGIRSGGSIACVRPCGRRPYAVHVVPMNPRETEFATSGPTAMVLIVDPERRLIPAPDMLRQLFGLTKTEAAVARLALNGEGLGPIGEQLQLSRDTVKTHLYSVFRKTGTHRQAELVRLLLAVTVEVRTNS